MSTSTRKQPARGRKNSSTAAAASNNQPDADYMPSSAVSGSYNTQQGPATTPSSANRPQVTQSRFTGPIPHSRTKSGGGARGGGNSGNVGGPSGNGAVVEGGAEGGQGSRPEQRTLLRTVHTTPNSVGLKGVVHPKMIHTAFTQVPNDPSRTTSSSRSRPQHPPGSKKGNDTDEYEMSDEEDGDDDEEEDATRGKLFKSPLQGPPNQKEAKKGSNAKKKSKAKASVSGSSKTTSGAAAAGPSPRLPPKTPAETQSKGPSFKQPQSVSPKGESPGMGVWGNATNSEWVRLLLSSSTFRRRRYSRTPLPRHLI